MKAKKINKVQQVYKMLQANPKIKTAEVMEKLGTSKTYTYVLMSKARTIIKRTTKAPMQASGAIGKMREEAWQKGIQLAHDIHDKAPEKTSKLIYRLTVTQAMLAAKMGVPIEDYAKLHGEVVGVQPDPVNHPAHYTSGGIETIDFIEAKRLGYNLGNVVKYITRAGHKGNQLEDLRKAQWYLTREINSMK
jgi:hypothetical protein